jgi:hypothetical protein
MTLDPNTDTTDAVFDDPTVDPHEAALRLLDYVRDVEEQADTDPMGLAQRPAPSEVANVYARAGVYATLALVEAVNGLTRQIAET